MPYDPNKHNRRSLRLHGYDYTQAGAYFVTICVQDRHGAFGKVIDGIMRPSPIGEVTHRFWQEIPDHFTQVTLDAFVVMPNHVHGIVFIVDDDAIRFIVDDDAIRGRDTTCRVPTMIDTIGEQTENDTNLERFGRPVAGSLSTIIRSYKATVTRWCRRNGHPEFAWQSRYHDHIIRNDHALDRIRHYIHENPLRWHLDRNHPDQRG